MRAQYGRHHGQHELVAGCAVAAVMVAARAAGTVRRYPFGLPLLYFAARLAFAD